MLRREFLSTILGAIAGVSFLRAETFSSVLEKESIAIFFPEKVRDHFFRPSSLLARMRKYNQVNKSSNAKWV